MYRPRAWRAGEDGGKGKHVRPTGAWYPQNNNNNSNSSMLILRFGAGVQSRGGKDQPGLPVAGIGTPIQAGLSHTGILLSASEAAWPASGSAGSRRSPSQESAFLWVLGCFPPCGIHARAGSADLGAGFHSTGFAAWQSHSPPQTPGSSHRRPRSRPAPMARPGPSARPGAGRRGGWSDPRGAQGPRAGGERSPPKKHRGAGTSLAEREGGDGPGNAGLLSEQTLPGAPGGQPRGQGRSGPTGPTGRGLLPPGPQEAPHVWV